MPSTMQPLRDEHAELLPHIEQLRLAADQIDTAAPARGEIDESLAFLEHHLLPHAMAEDEVLYPAVARAMGSERATDTMRRDHVAVGALIEELGRLRDEIGDGTPTEPQAKEARRILYGLHTLVRVHFYKEEEIYVPILEEALTETDAADLYRNMEAAAEQARRQLASS